MDVKIIEKETGKVIFTYPVNVGGIGYMPSEEEVFSDAWKCAVDDKLVNPNNRAKYTFRVAKFP